VGVVVAGMVSLAVGVIVTRMIASARDILQRELPARIRFN